MTIIYYHTSAPLSPSIMMLYLRNDEHLSHLAEKQAELFNEGLFRTYYTCLILMLQWGGGLAGTYCSTSSDS